jgi:hypothetical protein
MDVKVSMRRGIIYEIEILEYETFSCLKISLRKNPKEWNTEEITMFFNDIEDLKEFSKKIQEAIETRKKINL